MNQYKPNAPTLSDVELERHAEIYADCPDGFTMRAIATIAQLKADLAEVYEKAADWSRKHTIEKQRAASLEAQLASVVEALNWFCGRVDKGEVQSKRTYARFKQLLASLPTAASNLLDRVKRVEAERDGYRALLVDVAQRLGEPDFADLLATKSLAENEELSRQYCGDGLGEQFQVPIDEMKANARTPGTVEVCSREGTVKGPMRCGLPLAFGKVTFKMCRLSKGDEPCPIKRASSEEKNNGA